MTRAYYLPAEDDHPAVGLVQGYAVALEAE